MAESDLFSNFILGCIAVNTVNMMIRHFPESQGFSDAQEWIGYIFTAIFVTEFAVKHLGYGLAGYWSVSWNRLDGRGFHSSTSQLNLSRFVTETTQRISQ